MENLKAAVPFILLGVVGGWLGFAVRGLLSSLFIGIGLNWLVGLKFNRSVMLNY